jgi:hypothetical protein
MHPLMRALRPNWKILLLFTIFLGIAMGGGIQAWAFTDQPPKPPLYDVLRPFPFWPIWMLLLLPLAAVTYPLRLLGLDIMGGPAWSFPVANLIHFYLLSCLLVSVFGWVKARWRSQRKVV